MSKYAANVVRALITLTAAIALSACATATTTVLEPAGGGQTLTFATVRIQGAGDTVTVPPEARSHFEARLNEYLFAKESRFKPGDALTIRYRFIQFDQGDRALRYFVSFGAGKGTLTVEVTFLDKSQK